jgi:hypothetical protein
MTYDFKLLPEALRAGAFALIVFIATQAANIQAQDDWKEWAVSAGIGAIAFVGAAVLGVLTRPRT